MTLVLAAVTAAVSIAGNLNPDILAALGRDGDALLAGRDPSSTVLMCGSGVTACHNILAMERAGLKGAKLFTGSWSGWIQDPSRPVARGA